MSGLVISSSSGTTATNASEITKILSQQYVKSGVSTKGHQLEGTMLNYIEKVSSMDRSENSEGLQRIDSIMRFSMHPLGVKFTAADFLLWGAIKGSPQILNEVSSGKYPEIERWFKGYIELLPFMSKVNAYQKEITAVLPLSFCAHHRNQRRNLRLKRQASNLRVP